MTNAYGPGSPFYVQGPGSPTDFIKMVDAMSQGRLKIQHFAAGELIPALEGFDAVSKGTVEMNCANAYFWAGKTFAAQYFTAVPFGFNFQGMNAWLYHGGGMKLWEEVYAPVQSGAHADGQHRRADDRLVQEADREGRRLQGPQDAHSRSWRAASMPQLGVDVKLLPGGEIFPALERGVIDAAEFVGPYQDRRLGLHKAAKFYHTTGWHEILHRHRADHQQGGLGFAAAGPAGDRQGGSGRLPGHQPVLVRCHQRGSARGSGHQPGRQGLAAAADVLAKLKEVTVQTLNDNAAKDPLVKKVHDSYMGFKKGWDKWAGMSEGVYHAQIRGQI